jgi:hypothetical protein
LLAVPPQHLASKLGQHDKERHLINSIAMFLLQAEARQQAWAGTAAGRAALKSVQQVKEERAQGRVVSNDTARDWLT